MKYSEYQSKSKFRGGAAFYIVLAACLLSIGGAAWFAAANIKNRDSDNDGGNSVISKVTESITSKVEEVVPSEVIPTEDVGQAVSSEPYTPKEETASKEEAKEPEAFAFSMPVEGAVIKGYSENTLQYSSTYGDMRIHTGVDIACEEGTAVSAAAKGTVSLIEENATLGTTLTIDHGNGIMTKYSALKDIKVKLGDKVASGDIIGVTTSVPSECADQSHLHLEVLKNGHPASPLDILGMVE